MIETAKFQIKQNDFELLAGKCIYKGFQSGKAFWILKWILSLATVIAISADDIDIAVKNCFQCVGMTKYPKIVQIQNTRITARALAYKVESCFFFAYCDHGLSMRKRR